MLVLVAGAAFCIWQRDNLSAAITAATSSSETIVNRAEESKAEQRTFLEENGIRVTPPGLDDLEGLLNGTVTVDEAKLNNGLLDTESGAGTTALPAETSPALPSASIADSADGQPQHEKKPDTEKETKPETEVGPEAVAKPEPSEDKPTAQQLVDQCVRSLYAYEIDLMAELGVLKQAAVSEYQSLPKEQQTHDRLVEIGLAGLNKCYDKEVVADRNVKSLLNGLRSELKAIGADTSVADTLWSYYCTEKSNTKEYYLNKYL